MIGLSVRSFAELLHLPAYEQERILYEQKYPMKEPQRFKIPYYQQALRGIRSYYRGGNDPRALADARAAANALSSLVKRRHNIRVLDSFQRGRQARRGLIPIPISQLSAQPYPGVMLRLQFDIEAKEGGQPRRIFYNLRDAPIERVVATTGLQVAYWVLDQSGAGIPLRALQYVDLKNGSVYSIARQNERILRLMRNNARIIATLWPAI